MPILTPIQCVEAFHLAFLRVLESRIDRTEYVVKGGVNLRAWFGSIRYSEDLDIDVLEGEVFEVKDRVEDVILSRPLAALLRTQGLTLAGSTRPKQSETTQRWKFELVAAGHETALRSKIEFSRRRSEDEFTLEPVLADVVRPYGIPAPSANHYTAGAAMSQKVRALAGRRETQARDIWDLEHLFRTTTARPSGLETDAVKEAVDRAADMPFEAYMAQVVPYLEAEHQELHGNPEAWQRIQNLVLERLLELLP